MTITQITITLNRNKEVMRLTITLNRNKVVIRLTTQQLFIITGKTWTVGNGRNIYLFVAATTLPIINLLEMSLSCNESGILQSNNPL
jgi:hypothetical protein